MTFSNRQSGVTLIEVLISLLILGIGVLGAAALQLNALKYTDSATLNSQASFIAYDMMDRIRANPAGNYNITSISSVSSTTALTDPRALDLSDFASNITSMGGTGANGTINVTNNVAVITITWNDSRAANALNANQATGGAPSNQTFTLTSRIAGDTVTQ
jgi:type IV pilus assembly protein PilV